MAARLAGVGVVVTRPAGQAAPLAAALARDGAQVVLMPLIEVVARQDPALLDEVTAVERADVLVVTSTNGAQLLGRAMAQAGVSVDAGTRVIAVGTATAAAMVDIGCPPDDVPARASGGAIVELLTHGPGLRGRTVVLARAHRARPEVPDGLRARGATVIEIALYDVAQCTPDPATLAQACACPVWVLTSPSGVDAACAAAGTALLARAALVTIGPTTSAQVRERGLRVAAEATDRSPEHLVEAVVSAAPTMGAADDRRV